MQHQCRRCGGNGPFAPSRVRRGDWFCSPCATAARLRTRCEDPLKLLAYNYYKRVHRPGQRTAMLSAQQVASILQRDGHASVISGSTDDLCLVPLPQYADAPMELEHIVVVTRREARSFARCNNPRQRYPQLYSRDRALEQTSVGP